MQLDLTKPISLRCAQRVSGPNSPQPGTKFYAGSRQVDGGRVSVMVFRAEDADGNVELSVKISEDRWKPNQQGGQQRTSAPPQQRAEREPGDESEYDEPAEAQQGQPVAAGYDDDEYGGTF